ncbi:MAG TPA: serine/threonine-protein kinase [Xanthomonadaceae bacterium]|nr:serine/threonine-protein kinase [Xanthomonadaceae bacterium]
MPSDPKDAAVPSRGADAGFPRIPGYRTQKRLGRGGMATVYLATQESLDRPVSIKVMEGDALADGIAGQRFENEARTIARLSHPNIVAIYEVGRTGDGRLYYVMPYLGSGDLTQRDLREDETRIVEVLRSLLSALGYAHARGIVHRDVKRGNVLFDADDRPMLADFGIALSKSEDARITTAGLAVGSSGYMAPEQARGDVVDGRADLYSVGVLAYELLTGELPYDASDGLALALMHAQDPIPRLPQGKRHWQPFIDRAMAKPRDARYRNAQEMAQALDPIERRSGRQVSSRVLRTIDRTVERGRWKGLLALASGAVVLVAGGLYARDRFASHGGTPAPAVAASPASAASSPAHEASAASPAASAQASPASSASSPADASSSASTDQDASSSTKPATHTHHAPARRHRPQGNAFTRWWHRL